MVAKSVFKVISVNETKIASIGVQSSPKFWIQKGGTKFSNLVWGKKRGEPKFFQNPRGEPKPYTLCQYKYKRGKILRKMLSGAIVLLMRAKTNAQFFRLIARSEISKMVL